MIKRTNWAGQPWLLVTHDDLRIEVRQCKDEGKDFSPLQAELDALLALDLALEDNQRRAEALLDCAIELPLAPDCQRREPSDLPGILAERPAERIQLAGAPGEAKLFDKALGGWLGRCCGCLLGKPVEGRKKWQIEKYLSAQNRLPLSAYFSRKSDKAIAGECGMNLAAAGLFEEDIACMPEDDDTNYTVTGMAIVQSRGPDFTPADVAKFWLNNIPILHTCTAERIAYRNLVNGIAPPESAAFRNPYREWIGAQIRADFFGYVNPGDPARAAGFAWRDAAISHVKNGIYGEMWVAAMLAAAYVCDDIETVIRAGLSQIPATSRLAEAILRMLAMRKSGKTCEAAVADIHARWNEGFSHDWCHTISNAEIVTLGLLWGKGDFEQTICRSVAAGFDTDCNGATAGSVLGVMLGAKRLPEKWTAPLKDTLVTGVAGYNRVSISDMARRTVALARAR